MTLVGPNKSLLRSTPIIIINNNNNNTILLRGGGGDNQRLLSRSEEGGDASHADSRWAVPNQGSIGSSTVD